MMKKLVVFICLILFWFVSSFANYSITRKDYNKVNYVNHKLEQIIESKYPMKKRYYYQMIVDTIDGYLALHKVSKRKKVMFLCVKTYFEKKLGFKIWNAMQVDIIE